MLTGRVGHAHQSCVTGTWASYTALDLAAQMLCFLSFSSKKFVISRSLSAISAYPIARTRPMSNLAAGKKAAAVKAVDDYVKVGDGKCPGGSCVSNNH